MTLIGCRTFHLVSFLYVFFSFRFLFFCFVSFLTVLFSFCLRFGVVFFFAVFRYFSHCFLFVFSFRFFSFFPFFPVSQFTGTLS